MCFSAPTYTTFGKSVNRRLMGCNIKWIMRVAEEDERGSERQLINNPLENICRTFLLFMHSWWAAECDSDSRCVLRECVCVWFFIGLRSLLEGIAMRTSIAIITYSHFVFISSVCLIQIAYKIWFIIKFLFKERLLSNDKQKYDSFE